MGDLNTGEIYQGAMRNVNDVPLTAEQAAELRGMPVDARKDELARLKEMLARPAGGNDIHPGPAQPESNPQPDLRSRDGAKDFLDYHAPDENQRVNHENVNKNFQVLLDNIWDGIPSGPGKTVAIRSLNRARMDFNAAIANHGG